MINREKITGQYIEPVELPIAGTSIKLQRIINVTYKVENNKVFIYRRLFKKIDDDLMEDIELSPLLSNYPLTLDEEKLTMLLNQVQNGSLAKDIKPCITHVEPPFWRIIGNNNQIRTMLKEDYDNGDSDTKIVILNKLYEKGMQEYDRDFMLKELRNLTPIKDEATKIKKNLMFKLKRS
jgi:hypothetical protein